MRNCKIHDVNLGCTYWAGLINLSPQPTAVVRDQTRQVVQQTLHRANLLGGVKVHYEERPQMAHVLQGRIRATNIDQGIALGGNDSNMEFNTLRGRGGGQPPHHFRKGEPKVPKYI